MTKIRKQKRRKKFRANVNRKRLRNKLQKLPDIGCDEIKQAWELKRSTRNNLNDMGLAYDPNDVLKIPNSKRELIQSVKRKANGLDSEEEDTNRGAAAKIHVAEKLEAEAKAPRERMFRLPNNQVLFVTYLLDKYGEDYKAMARDRRNHYQMTWRQIRAKVNTFKGIPEQYAEYLVKKGEIVLDDPTPLEETRKKIAEENIQKHCVSKKPKVTKKLWEVESLDGDDDKIESDDGTNDVSDNEENQQDSEVQNDGLKKLKLFPDDESDDEKQSKRKSKKLKSDTEKQRNGKMIEKNKLKNEEKNSKATKPIENIQNSQANKSKLFKETAKQKNTVNLAEENGKQNSKKALALQKSESSDSDSDEEELEGDDEETGFVDLSDMSEQELSDDDVLDDGEFVTDSD